LTTGTNARIATKTSTSVNTPKRAERAISSYSVYFLPEGHYLLYPTGLTGKSERGGNVGACVVLQYPFRQAVPKGQGGRSTPQRPSGTPVSQFVNPSLERITLSHITKRKAAMTNMIPAVKSAFILLVFLK
jgi:hypothetical protein